MVKLKRNISVKIIDGSLKYEYPGQWAFKSAGMDLNSFFLDAIDHETIKMCLRPP